MPEEQNLWHMWIICSQYEAYKKFLKNEATNKKQRAGLPDVQ